MRQKWMGKNILVNTARMGAYQWIALQLLLITVISLVLLFINKVMALSLLLGGLCCILPNVFFAFRFFLRVQTKEPNKILTAFYWGEFLKITMSVVFMLAVLLLLPIMILPFLVGFLVAHFGLWLSPFKKARVNG